MEGRPPQEPEEERPRVVISPRAGSLRDDPVRIRRGPPWDPKKARERTRSYLAGALVLALITATLSLIALVATNAVTVDEAKDLAVVAVSPLVAITGTALGFYFGGKKNGD